MRSNRLATLAVIAGAGLLGYAAGGVTAIAEDSTETTTNPPAQQQHPHGHDHFGRQDRAL